MKRHIIISDEVHERVCLYGVSSSQESRILRDYLFRSSGLVTRKFIFVD
jgi:hypothetical protein